MGVRSRLRRWLGSLLLVALLAPASVVLALRWLPPPGSSVIWQARLASDEPVRQRWVPLEQIAPALQLAVIASEDQRFASHWGFDVEAIWDALSSDGRLRGASTLTQQVAKNLFLWQERSWLRKGLEAYLTGWIELLWPKRRILEVYLNIAQFGAREYGAAAAGATLFGTGPGAISERQAALLAACLPNPVQLHAERPSDYVRQRAAWIRIQMRQLGYGYLEEL